MRLLPPQAPSHKYSAHSSHVTNVTFMHNDSHLVSTGGKDTSVMQWRLVEKTPSLVPSDSSLSLGEGLLHNSILRAAIPAVPLTPTPTKPAATPTPTPPTVLDLTSDPTAAHCGGVALVTPPPTPTSPTTNGRQESSPETPPPAELTPPPSDSTLSLKDSLDPSDDTATPSDEGRPFTPPS